MRVARLIGVAVVVILVVSALAAAAASAFPEFRVLPLRPQFTWTSGVTIVHSPNTTFTCQTDEADGELTSMDSVGKVVVTYKGCVIQEPGCTAKLQSLTAKEGELVTNLIVGRLGTVATSEATTGVGVLFEPAVGTKFLTFKEAKTQTGLKCFPEATLAGSFAGEVAPINHSQKTLKVAILPKSTGSSEPKIKSITILSGRVAPELVFATEELTESSTELVTFDQVAEVT